MPCRQNTPPLTAHRESLACVSSAAPRLEALLESTDVDADLAAFCDTAARSVAAGEALAARQSSLLAGVLRELAASPEVLRSGAMESWDAPRGAWVPDRYVLTRAGFLHRLARREGGEGRGSGTRDALAPVLAETLALSRCAFEQGEPRRGMAKGGGLGACSAIWARPAPPHCCE